MGRNMFVEAESQSTIIKEALTFEDNITKNKIWYRGDAEELDQFYTKHNSNNVSKGRFWSSVPSEALLLERCTQAYLEKLLIN